ncbi:MAG: TonB-dependent receptor, partial [Bacteroidales bacterium]|nr:TonB-dependent receptor [Bacteroidales bacterium]
MKTIKSNLFFKYTNLCSKMFLLLGLCSVSAFAQRGNVISEAQKRVTDNTGVVVCHISDENNKPLEYTTVAILNPNDSSLVSGTVTNVAGFAVIDAIPWGTYLVRITYIGYKPLFISNISVTKEKPVANMGKQQIQTSANQLEGVTVSAQKEMIETNLDKRVFNVDKSIVTEGSTGVDVLENIPSVTVDLDGNVSLRGSQSVTILINGRPTDLTMDEIPASTIESIEVVTNPSARYEPSGTSGIINIVLKKERKLGFNASLSLGAGLSNMKKEVYFGRYSATLNLNFRYNKFNFFANYSFRSFSFHSETDLERENIFQGTTTLLSQQSTNSFQGMPQGLRGGFDYFINQYNTITIEGGFRHGSRQGETAIHSLTQNPLADTLSLYDQQSLIPPIGTNSWDAAVNYVHSTKVKGQELVVDISMSEWNRNGEVNLTQFYLYPSSYEYYQQSNTVAKSHRITAQLDFVTPIGNGGRLETGYKFNWNRSVDNYQFFSGNTEQNLQEDLNRNENSKYIDNVNAIYLVYSNTIKTKFKYQLGLRAELAKITSQLKTIPEPFTPKPYFDVFPTIHLRYDFNAIHSLQLGYSIRIRRPRGGQLNPFLDDTDKQNLRQGNRKLKPEYTHSIDLGYLMAFKKTSISANLFYRYRYDIISQYTVLINDSTTYTTYENLDNSHSYGLEFSYQQDIFKFWKLSLNASLFQTFVNADTLYDESLTNDFSWQLRLNNNFNLPKDFQIQLSANYLSPTLTLNSMGHETGGAGQGRMSAMWGIDIGIRKSFFKRALSISLRASDIFYTRKVHVNSQGSTSYSSYNSTMNRYRDTR